MGNKINVNVILVLIGLTVFVLSIFSIIILKKIIDMKEVNKELKSKIDQKETVIKEKYLQDTTDKKILLQTSRLDFSAIMEKIKKHPLKKECWEDNEDKTSFKEYTPRDDEDFKVKYEKNPNKYKNSIEK